MRCVSLFAVLVLVLVLAGSFVSPVVAQPSTYPTDSWDRLWYEGGWDYDDLFWYRGDYLGETQETTLMFDTNWNPNGCGEPGTPIAFGRYDYIEFTSGRTIDIPASGVYTFYLGSDDGSRLFIDDVKVIDQWEPQGYLVRAAYWSLTAGSHRFRIDWFEETGCARVSFRYALSLTLTPQTACAGATISAVAMFTGTSPGSPSFSSNPPGLDFDPGRGLPDQPHFCNPDASDPYRLNCDFVVKSASCGQDYTITLTATTYDPINQISRTESVSAEFTVPDNCCPTSAAVGGCVEPANTLAIVDPWLAVIGLVSCISTAVVILKRPKK